MTSVGHWSCPKSEVASVRFRIAVTAKIAALGDASRIVCVRRSRMSAGAPGANRRGSIRSGSIAMPFFWSASIIAVRLFRSVSLSARARVWASTSFSTRLGCLAANGRAI